MLKSRGVIRLISRKSEACQASQVGLRNETQLIHISKSLILIRNYSIKTEVGDSGKLSKLSAVESKTWKKISIFSKVKQL